MPSLLITKCSSVVFALIGTLYLEPYLLLAFLLIYLSANNFMAMLLNLVAPMTGT
jgi:hypothetical protein